MDSKIIDGKKLSFFIRENLKKKLEIYLEKGYRKPSLCVIIIGENEASKIYVKNKCKACNDVLFISRTIKLPDSVSEVNLLKTIKNLNKDKNIDGILVQLPLPSHIKENVIIENISPTKDVDGFHPFNVGNLALRNPSLRPCTPKGIVTLLKSLDINLLGMHVVIVGSSNIVGRPLILELLLQKCTVTNCHRFTKDLKSFTKQADILISAVGKVDFIDKEMIKDDVILIDVGINRLDNSKIVGDFNKNCYEKAKFYTPVPGGVGPMTVASLLENTLYAYEKNIGII